MTRQGDGYAPVTLRAVALVAALALGACATGGLDTGGDVAVNAAPGSNEEFTLAVGRIVYFTENSADLSEIARETLDKQAAWLSRYPRDQYRIDGFADVKGSAAVNMTLGQRRADAVRAYLVSKGVSASAITTKSLGNTQPVKRCNDISSWSQNRRAVTVVTNDASG